VTIAAGELDRRITIYRSPVSDDGFSAVASDPVSIGTRWAKKTDVSDGERIAAAAQQQSVTTRFLVRYDDVTSTLASTDQIDCDGLRYEITGTKEARGRRVGVEISAAALKA
jgi:SPP1 family predicted phage head-tail adaptor